VPGGSQIPTGSIWGGGQSGRLIAANGWSAWSAAVDERLYSFVRIGASHPGGQGVSVEQDPHTESPTLPLHWGGTAAEGRSPHAAAGPRPAPSSGCSPGAPRLEGQKRLQAGLVVTARTRLTRLCPVHSACGPLAPHEDQLQLRRAWHVPLPPRHRYVAEQLPHGGSQRHLAWHPPGLFQDRASPWSVGPMPPRLGSRGGLLFESGRAGAVPRNARPLCARRHMGFEHATGNVRPTPVDRETQAVHPGSAVPTPLGTSSVLA
jgi:hypothetical protein